MTLGEFTKIINLYGTEPSCWPSELYAQCQTFLATNSEAEALLQQQKQVDELMEQLTVPDFPGLEHRVLNQALPARDSIFLDRLLSWLIPDNNIGKQIWRPACAACMPLFIGILLGNFFSFGIGIEDDSFPYWDDELVMLSLSDYTESTF